VLTCVRLAPARAASRPPRAPRTRRHLSRWQSAEKELKAQETAYKAVLAKPPTYVADLEAEIAQLEAQLQALAVPDDA
jgi:hypothetical protein